MPTTATRFPRRPVFVRLAAVWVALLALCVGSLGGAQATADEGDPTAPVYRTPASALTALIDAPPTPRTQTSPGGDWIALLERPSLPPIQELASRELRLAGLRIDPAVSGPSRSYPLDGITLLRVADGSERPITGLPEAPRLADATWSPDGSHLVFSHTTADRVELWVAEAASGEARRLADVALNQVGRVQPTWLPDSSGLAVVLVPEGRGAEPTPAAVPSGPVIQQNLGRTAPARTYQDLLEDSHDEALFEHYLEGQPAVVGLDGSVRTVGEPGLVWAQRVSPDGRFLMLEWIHPPYSYLVPATRFPRRTEIRRLTGEAAGSVVKVLADVPLQDEVSMAFSSTTAGPRNFGWRSDQPAAAYWVEALDGGDANQDVEERDRLFQLAAPFSGEPQVLATFGKRFGGMQWGRDDLALAFTWWWSDRSTRAWRLRPGVEGSEPEMLLERSFEDRYSDPGNVAMTRNDSGHWVVLAEGETVFLLGDGASDEGDRPFVDEWDLTSGEKTRLFRSEAPFYEEPLAVLDADSRTVLTLREAVETVPQLYVRQLAADAGEPRQLTSFPHPSPQLQGISKELIRYQREDGVDLNGTLYLPAGYDAEADGPLPLVLWAYPQEFKSADAAGQISDSPYRFSRVGWWSPLVWLTQGYAVLDDPTLPIIGEGDDEPNDTYVEQLVAGAQAAVDAVVERGVADPARVAIGGHSYGAFMTANLLAHSDIFAAGIARSGAYNRTLTPFGFQAEERSLWDAPEVYFAMSPFMHAEKVNEPILLIHGDSDNNSGTFPMQSERYYNALKGHGATARLVMLPHESHGYRARESVLHMMWETQRWLDDYVKNREVAEAAEEGGGSAEAGE